MSFRKCEICGSFERELLTKVRFISSGSGNPIHYDVVSCRQCGFLFAGNIPSQELLRRHYRSSLKYGYNERIPEGLERIYLTLSSSIDAFLAKQFGTSAKRSLKIMDVGCSTGHLLNLVRKNGYRKVMGIEPSRYCSRIAKEKYGIPVFEGTLAEYKGETGFDLVILSGVLEHLSNLDAMLPLITNLMADGGALFIVVPDAGHFSGNPRAPFDEFSLEHVNFFTRQSLVNLMGNHHLAPVSVQSVPAEFYDSHCLLAYFNKKKPVWKKDTQGRDRLKKYIAKSETTAGSIDRILKPVLKSGTEIVVWGAGSLSSRLLSGTSLGDARITAFVDSNRGLWGKRLGGIPIKPPAFIQKTDCRTVFIGSYIYKDEIIRQLRQTLGFSGEILSV